MSLNNDFAKSYFKTDQHGRRTFYPYGNFGKVYLLPEGEHESLLVNFIRTFLIVTGICSTASGIFLGVVFTLGQEVLTPLLLILLVGLFSSIWYEYQIRKILVGVERSDEKMSFQEYLNNIYSTISKRSLHLLLFGSGVLAALNLFILIELDGGALELALAFGFVLFSLALLYLLKLKSRQS